MSQKKIVIIGSGPAGSSTAHFLAKAGIPHVLIDKAVFPRAKVCGDGLAPKACMMLDRMYPDFMDRVAHSSSFLPVWGGLVSAPSGHTARLYLRKPDAGQRANALSIPRIVLDHYLQQQLDTRYTDLRTGTQVCHIERKGERFMLTLRHQEVEETLAADILIGCDGDRSIVKKTLAPLRMDPEHYVAGIRTYFNQVKAVQPDPFFELYFLKDLLPAYLWVFPLPDGRVNVGLGMTTSDVSAQRANLREILNKTLAENPIFKDRFADAVQEGKLEGWGLPLGSKKCSLSGPGFLLTGDAGSLIDPLTGEGVGNALYSGWLAAEAVTKAVLADRTDAAFLKLNYDDRVERCLRPELRFAAWVTRLFRYPKLLNYLFNRLDTRPIILTSINRMFDADTDNTWRYDPRFYLRVVWAFLH